MPSQNTYDHSRPGPAIVLACIAAMCVSPALSADPTAEQQRAAQRHFQPMDVFKLEWASDLRISPDGTNIVYVRNFMDVMNDSSRSSLWSIRFDGSDHRPLTRGNHSDSQPRWSPNGKRMVYISNEDGTTQMYVRFMDTGQTTRLTQLTQSPAGMSWSPDGRWIAFSMLVPSRPQSWVQLPQKPKDAEWADPPKVIESLTYRSDGRGYLEDGFNQIFLLSSEGGTARQLTFDSYHHGGTLAWTANSEAIIFSANRQQDWQHDPLESELYELSIAAGELRQITDRNGPDEQPTVSPDGRSVAYVGFDDRLQGYQNSQLYIADLRTRSSHVLTKDFDHSIYSPTFSADGKGVFYLFDEKGNTKLGYVSLNGRRSVIAGNVGGLSLGRPYSSGSYSISDQGHSAFTLTEVDHPADVAAVQQGSEARRLTRLNDDLFAHKSLAEVEEFWCKSSHDQRKIQGWIVKPPDFDPAKKYPLLLEIHGGPFANYGDRFSAEMQLYAAAGYLVLYVNPRGSTSYGEEFANLIHHNYPGQDFDDLMSAVDFVIDRGYVDTDKLNVTGGSGGGVLTAWIVGHTDRFRAAVVAKPVINWYSFALTADAYNFFYKYWFPGPPWEHPQQYLRRSPISYVGKVKTPTMLITGEADYRTPISETEQFYQALKLLKVDTALVRIPGASHSITSRPSRLIAKTAYVLGWLQRHDDSQDETGDGT